MLTLFALCLFVIVSMFDVILTDFSLVRDKRQADFLRNELDNFLIVHPQKVSSDGTILSNDVRHKFKRRLRRSLIDQVKSKTLYYILPFPESNLTLKLSSNFDILSPGFVIERRNGNWKTSNLTSKFAFAENKYCYFKGSIKESSNSHVAVSTCYGLTGLIRNEQEEFFIEPLKGHLPSSIKTLPHVIYKRSALKASRQAQSCGVSDDVPSVGRTLNFLQKNILKNNPENFRAKRSVSMERYVETLVVADREMVEYYANEDIETYILTVMNMVSTLFHDASIGNAINIVLVRLMLLESEKLEDENEGLQISKHADSTLKSFCRWQKFINPSDENHPHHHDVAILLTRYNICSKTNEPCSTLGLAEVAGMCQPHRSCNVNEDTGLALAYTIAHEMGHNFGMSHDSPQNGCQAPLGEKQHVMSPHLNSDASPFVWSNCSRWEITKFLDRDWGSCLDDKPSDHKFFYPELPPGAMYDTDHQCRLQYGYDAEFCEGIEDVCQTLWCRQQNKCITRLEPAAEGTLCDKNMWCHMGECTVISEKPNSNDGEWGSWSEWSDCSRSCGAGVQHAERYCNNPSPAWGGRFCIGERKRYKICNTKKCPENSPSFRAVQCKRFNAVPYKDEIHSWLPVSTPLTPCQLHCKPDGQFFSVMLDDTVEDGTECNPGTRDICINGKCRKVSCDWGIESDALEDRCGVCHGDGTQCLTFKGEFNQKLGLGYVDVVTIPKNSRNIRVEEISEATNYIAVKGSKNDFYLNGQWFIQWSGEYQGAGTTFYYQRDGEKDILQIPGPIAENIYILLLYQAENPGLIYEYTVPNKNASRKPEFHWEYSDWTICSETCGGGMQILLVKCVEKEAGRVEEDYCDPRSKPLEKTRLCNKHDCPAKWWTGPWQHCSVSCGGNGIRQRTVICIRSLGSDEQIALHDEECTADERPIDNEPCRNQIPCKFKNPWDAGQWTDVCKEDPCNFQSRHVYCSHPSGQCEENIKPSTRRQCRNITCGHWVVGNWSQCSASCGEGIKTRNVSCSGGIICHKATEPISNRKCNVQHCFTGASENSNVTTENGDIFNDLFLMDDLENWISNDDVLLSDLFEHTDKLELKERKKQRGNVRVNRPFGIARDVVYHQKFEIRDPQSDDPRLTKRIKNGSLKYAYAMDNDIPKERKYFWKENKWSKCSEHCDGGQRHREVICIDIVSKHTVVDTLCDPYVKPPTSEACNVEPCLEWVTTEWTQCSVKCGEGKKKREVYCPVTFLCNRLTRPSDVKGCTVKPCLQWINGPWTRCSTSCGEGVQTRQQRCVNITSNTPAVGCDPHQKSIQRKNCRLKLCSSATSSGLTNSNM